MTATSAPPRWSRPGGRRLILAVALALTTVSVACEDDPGKLPSYSNPATTVEVPTPDSGTLPVVAGPAVRPAVPAAYRVAAPMPRSAPIRLRIADIGVDSELMELGLQPDRTMEVPPAGFPAGWYVHSPTPGELGPAVLAGHVDWGGRPGVFAALHTLEPGTLVTVDRADGSHAVFRILEVQRHSKTRFPTDVVYGDIDHPGLRLITCGGSFDATADSYRDNVIAFGVLVETLETEG